MPLGQPPAPRARRHRVGAVLRCAAGWLSSISLGAALVASWALLAQDAQAAPPPQLVWQDGARLQAAPAAAATARTPLGSTWKLFVHAYLVDTGAQEPPYRCEAAQRRSDDDYCCEPGESVDRDTALQRSCGAYFAPQRLKLDAAAWRRHWAGTAPAIAPAAKTVATGTSGVPAWLPDLPALQPATEVPVAELLQALRRISDPARQAARQALLPNTLRDAGVLGALGSGPRFKTWSWHDARGERIGGAAGWLADGAPFWFGAGGTGRRALQAQAGWLATRWMPTGALTRADDAAGLQAQPCVEVAFFARYPLATLRRDDGRPLPEGPLPAAALTLQFANGQALSMRGSPALQWRATDAGPRLTGRLPLEDYVARVVDREGDARETAAARALAIAARAWLLQNTAEHGGCRPVDDDSRAQRVSPSPPTTAARAVAAFTAGLVLQGADVRYHRDTAAPNQLGWLPAVEASRAGAGFEALLRQPWPAATLAGWHGGTDCIALPAAATWLAQREARWRDTLRREAGYEPPGAALQVCQLQHGVPHADQRRLRVHVREWASREGRVALIHEYLHLAFRHHPRGHDEAFVEALAQRLADL